MKELSKNTSTLLFVLLTGVLVVIAFTSYNKIRQFNKSVDLVMDTQIVKDNIVELRSIVKDAESGQRGYLITNDSVFLQPVIGAEQRSNLVLAKYDSLISDNVGQKENLKKLKTLLAQRYLLLNKTLKSFKNKPSANLPTDSLLLESKNKMDEVRKQIALMLQTEDKLLEQRIQVKDRKATLTPIFLLLLSLFSIVALTLFFFRLQKETNSRVSIAKLVEVEAEARKQIEASELFNRTVLESSPDCLKVLDNEGRIQYMNFNGLCQMEIDDFSTFKNKNWWTIWGSENEALVKASLDKAITGKIAQFIAYCPTDKGTPKWWDVVVSPVGKAGEPVQQIISVSRDITEQKKSEEAIEKIASHLKLATDSANVGTWSFNVQTQELEWSAVHKRMWGYDEHRTDLIFEDWHKPILSGDKEKVFEKIEEAKDNHTSYDVEYCINRANDDAVRCIRSVGKYYYNDKGKAETLTGITIDITEKNQIEDTLRYRKALLEAHNEANRDGLLLVDAKGKIISYNQSFIDVWRMPKEIVDSKDDELALAFAMTQLVNPQQFVDKVKWLYEHPSETSIDELEFLDGRIIERHGYSVFGEDGTYYAWSWTFRDITEQKAAAKAKKEIEKRISNERLVLYNSFMNAPASIAILKGDTFIYEFANTEYERLLNRKIIIGKTVQELLPELEAQGIMAILNTVFTTGEPFIADEFPVELMDKSTGELVLGYYNIVIQPMKDEKGNTERLLSHGVEVTQHVEARKQIEASETSMLQIATHLKLATDSANVGTWSLDVKKQKLEWSALHKKMWGYDEHRKDIAYEDWHKLILPEDKDKAFEKIEEARIKNVIYDVEYRISSAEDETVRYMRSVGKYYYNDKGEAETLTGISLDITKQKEAEGKIKEARELLETTFQNVPSAIYNFDKTGKILYLNEIGANQIGYATTEEVLAEKDVFQLRKRAYETFTVLNEQGEPMPVDQNSTALTFKTGKSSEVVSQLINKKTGASLWLLSRATPIFDDNDQLIKVLSTSTDITLQKAAVEAIKESEVKFRVLSETIPNMIWTALPDGKRTFFNQYMLDYTGKTSDELYGDGWQQMIAPLDLERTLKQWHHSIQTGEDYINENRWRHHDGSYQWYLAHAIAQKDEEGNILGWVGTNTNITEQKSFSEVLEEKVKERTHQLHIQNETFKVAEKVAKFGSYKWNMNTDSLEYSDNLFRIFDCKPNEFIPSLEKFLSFIHLDDLQNVIENEEETRKTGKLIESSYRIISKKGKIKHLRSSGSFTGGNKNHILVGTVQDITEDLEVAEELIEKQDYLNQVINNAPDSVIVINEKGMITLWNPKTEDIFGWKAEEVLGMDLSEIIIPKEYREGHREGMNRFLETGETRVLNKTLELSALNKAGKVFPVSLTVSQATQHGNKLFIAFLRDITLEKQNKEEIIAKTEQLAKMNHSLELKNIELENTIAELNSFTYVASHDLQEPLRKIQSFSKRIIEVEEFSDKTQDYFNRIIAAGERMQNLIVSLLEFSQTSATELIFEPCDLNVIVEESKDNLHLSIIEKNAVVEYENLPTINAARVQLSQLFTNLIDNAIKYSRPEINPHIKITASIIEGKKIEHTSAIKQTTYHAIQFADNGIGFEQEYENKIFELFQRLHGKNEYSGTGIGLGIVKKIVNNHNGFIVAKGEPNTGATFTIYIPTA